MDKEMYIKIPDGIELEGVKEMCRHKMALNETKQAGRL